MRSSGKAAALPGQGANAVISSKTALGWTMVRSAERLSAMRHQCRPNISVSLQVSQRHAQLLQIWMARNRVAASGCSSS